MQELIWNEIQRKMSLQEACLYSHTGGGKGREGDKDIYLTPQKRERENRRRMSGWYTTAWAR